MSATSLDGRAKTFCLLSVALLLASVSPLFGAAPRSAKRPAHAAAGANATPASRLWSSMLKRCGDSYFYTGSAFDNSGMLNDVQMSHTQLVEYKGVSFASVPIRVTDAERANGIEYRARISMRAHLYRVDGDSWQDGPDLRPRNMNDIIGRALADVGSDLFDIGTSGSMALEMIKYHGRWYVLRSSVDRSGPLIGNKNIFDLEQMMALPRPTYDCASQQVVMPKGKDSGEETKADDNDDKDAGNNGE